MCVINETETIRLVYFFDITIKVFQVPFKVIQIPFEITFPLQCFCIFFPDYKSFLEIIISCSDALR